MQALIGTHLWSLDSLKSLIAAKMPAMPELQARLFTLPDVRAHLSSRFPEAAQALHTMVCVIALYICVR